MTRNISATMRDRDSGVVSGNHMQRVEWSRYRWRHMTPKSQGCDPNIFEAEYLNNRAR